MNGKFCSALRELEVDQKIARLKEKNKRLEERHRMIQADKKFAEISQRTGSGSHGKSHHSDGYMNNSKEAVTQSGNQKERKSVHERLGYGHNDSSGKKSVYERLGYPINDSKEKKVNNRNNKPHQHPRESKNEYKKDQTYFESRNCHQDPGQKASNYRGMKKTNKLKSAEKANRQECRGEGDESWKQQREEADRERLLRHQSTPRQWDAHKKRAEPWDSGSSHKQSHYQHDNRKARNDDADNSFNKCMDYDRKGEYENHSSFYGRNDARSSRGRPGHHRNVNLRTENRRTNKNTPEAHTADNTRGRNRHGEPSKRRTNRNLNRQRKEPMEDDVFENPLKKTKADGEEQPDADENDGGSEVRDDADCFADDDHHVNDWALDVEMNSPSYEAKQQQAGWNVVSSMNNMKISEDGKAKADQLK